MDAPVFVSGGKRLNFTREDEWTDEITESFSGYGKDQSCSPSATWPELCALATVISEHPAYVPITELSGYYQPHTEDVEDVR